MLRRGLSLSHWQQKLPHRLLAASLSFLACPEVVKSTRVCTGWRLPLTIEQALYRTLLDDLPDCSAKEALWRFDEQEGKDDIDWKKHVICQTQRHAAADVILEQFPAGVRFADAAASVLSLALLPFQAGPFRVRLEPEDPTVYTITMSWCPDARLSPNTCWIQIGTNKRQLPAELVESDSKKYEKLKAVRDNKQKLKAVRDAASSDADSDQDDDTYEVHDVELTVSGNLEIEVCANDEQSWLDVLRCYLIQGRSVS
jgi:hypothetical protein